MKNKISKGIALLLMATILICSLTSCSELLDRIGRFDEPTSSVETNVPMGDIIINGDSVTNDVTIQIQGNDLSVAASEGLRSIVSVYCNYGVSASGGAGVIYDINGEGDAFLITNYHVVYNSKLSTADKICTNISVYLYGMESKEYAIPATYVGGSMNYDIAVLRVENNEILRNAYLSGVAKKVKIADSDKIVIGQKTLAIGNPALGGISVSSGVISVDSENISLPVADDKSAVTLRVMRTDTAVNSGNSGGGFFNDKGELIGIVNAKISSSEIENIGYAIPSNVARGIADNIIDYCYGKSCKTVMRGILGITVRASELYTKYDTETGHIVKMETVIVDSVSNDGLGAQILQKNDIVRSITIGERQVDVTRTYHLVDAMLDARVGETVYFEIERAGVTQTVSTVITSDCLVAY